MDGNRPLIGAISFRIFYIDVEGLNRRFDRMTTHD